MTNVDLPSPFMVQSAQQSHRIFKRLIHAFYFTKHPLPVSLKAAYKFYIHVVCCLIPVAWKTVELIRIWITYLKTRGLHVTPQEEVSWLWPCTAEHNNDNNASSKTLAGEDVESRVLLSKRGREIESKSDDWGPFSFEDHAMVSGEDERCRRGSNV